MRNGYEDSLLELTQAKLLDTIAHYPNARIPDETVQAYLRSWVGVCKKLGTRRFIQAVESSIETCTRFPTIADLYKNAPAPLPISTSREVTPEERKEAVIASTSPEKRIFREMLKCYQQGGNKEKMAELLREMESVHPLREIR